MLIINYNTYINLLMMNYISFIKLPLPCKAIRAFMKFMTFFLKIVYVVFSILQHASNRVYDYFHAISINSISIDDDTLFSIERLLSRWRIAVETSTRELQKIYFYYNDYFLYIHDLYWFLYIIECFCKEITLLISQLIIIKIKIIS